jgi:hypothetical protein
MNLRSVGSWRARHDSNFSRFAGVSDPSAALILRIAEPSEVLGRGATVSGKPCELTAEPVRSPTAHDFQVTRLPYSVFRNGGTLRRGGVPRLRTYTISVHRTRQGLWRYSFIKSAL